jgi:Cell Wall Hydrolase
MAHIRLRLRVPGDAGNKGAEGQAAVVHSILNRWVSGRYGSTPTQVVPAPGQYERGLRADRNCCLSTRAARPIRKQDKLSMPLLGAMYRMHRRAVLISSKGKRFSNAAVRFLLGLLNLLPR